MNSKARLISLNADGIKITGEYPPDFRIEMANQYRYELVVKDARAITRAQQNHIHALLNDISIHTGYPPEMAKVMMKKWFVDYYGEEDFSCRDTDMTTARRFIEFLIEFCIEQDVYCKVSLLERAPDIGKYVYACLLNKKCCVCGIKTELHHTKAIGMGRKRKEICHIGMTAEPLCRKHHTECHDIGQRTFDEKYHIYGIEINELIARIYKL